MGKDMETTIVGYAGTTTRIQALPEGKSTVEWLRMGYYRATDSSEALQFKDSKASHDNSKLHPCCTATPNYPCNLEP